MFLLDIKKDNNFRNNETDKEIDKKIYNNKCKLIEYHILINLIFKNKGIHMYNNFIKEITIYLEPNKIYLDISRFYLPIYDIFYFNQSLIDFINIFNIKNNLLLILLRYKNLEVYSTYIQFYWKRFENLTFLCLYIKIYIPSFFKHDTHNFNFEIPVKYIVNKKNLKKISYKDFNKIVNMIWSDNNGTVLDDYVFLENNLKKHIYLDFFKKVFLRI